MLQTLRALDDMLHTLVFVHPTASIGEELKNVFQVSCARGGCMEEGCSSVIPTTPKTFWGDPGGRSAEQQLLFPQVLLPFTSMQNSAARQRVVGRIWKLCHSLAHYCQERVRARPPQPGVFDPPFPRSPLSGRALNILLSTHSPITPRDNPDPPAMTSSACPCWGSWWEASSCAVPSRRTKRTAVL